MPAPSPLLALCAALLLAAALPARAESFASSASSAGSASSGSVSDSIEGSSDSSSRDKEVVDGDYRVIELADAAGRPDTLRLRLRAEAPVAAEFVLYVPRQALAERGLAVGDLVQTRQRIYGYEFRRADTRQPFFLALRPDWQHELDSRVVAL
ncbi:hypothetical protein CLD22_14710 [Rubrivivax gelatinosus]|nr:hypothetical protein [Rubrivivax gelatinosus]